MSFSHLIKYALTLSPRTALRGGLRYVTRSVTGSLDTVKQSNDCTYAPVKPEATCYRLLPGIPLSTTPSDLFRDWSESIIEHRFDLLGSGPVKIEYGMEANGFGLHRYPAQFIDTAADSLVARLNPGNRARARAIRDLISTEYHPIDWHLDFKSGYRWSEGIVAKSIKYGHEASTDIKVPWELARLQHLPALALANFNSGKSKYRKEFENQILDFMAANPPGWGVNWVCTMDVAIRAANMIMAFDLFRAKDEAFSPFFQDEFIANIRAHGRHIVQNLEWAAEVRGNHYLANISGLTFIAAFLPTDKETDLWLAFAVQELIAESELQFFEDGENFEGSTSYHRLSAEMVAYATAIILGLPEDRYKALADVTTSSWPHRPKLNPSTGEWHGEFGPFPERHFDRLQRMAEFSIAVTKPSGYVAQIGDNDSGRFIRFDLSSHSLDHRATVAAINGLFGRQDFTEFCGPRFGTEFGIVRSLSGRTDGLHGSHSVKSTSIDLAADQTFATELTQIDIILPNATVLQNLSAIGYPDFGLFIWRSDRLFLSVRCGQVGQNGRGGHAHNDQLSIELQIDGQDWIADPGSYVYTADPKLRDAYRSIHAHATPRFGVGEPSSLGLGMFRLEDNANARVLQFDKTGFHGVHTACGPPVFRQIKFGEGKIKVLDGFGGEQPGTVTPDIKIARSGEDLRRIFDLNLPFSAGYGLRD